MLTLTPYDFWRHTHAIHHATSGHLERRGMGDVDTLTVREYQLLSFWGRLRYRAYRHPLVMFGNFPVSRICFLYSKGCRLDCSAAVGDLGLARWRPPSPSQP